MDPNTAEARRTVYERARQAIVKQLRSYDPPLAEAEITKERLGLEEAVRRIESEHRASQQQQTTPPPAAPERPAASPAAERGAAERAAVERSAAERPAQSPQQPAVGSASPRPVAAEQAPGQSSGKPSGSGPSSAPPAPPRPAATSVAGDGLVKVHAAAAAAASLGAATASARASALTTRAAFEPASQRGAPQRTEPNFERPRVPGPLPEARPPAMESTFAQREIAPPGEDDHDNGQSEAPRAARMVGLIAIIALIGLGVGTYLARDQIAGFFGDEAVEIAEPADSGPKVDDRVGTGDAVPGDDAAVETPPATSAEPAPETAAEQPASPATPSDAGALVSQRATLYDEAPDAQSGAAATTGSINWRTEPVPSNPSEVQLVGDISIPERGMRAMLTMTRNLDETLPASHLIEIVFTLPDDFVNGGVGNVPGILFKQTEADGGSALKGMSAKVTKNIFLIGLEKTPADHEQNMQAIRSRGWIDLPILYENGRRAVLTIEKGTPGERAFAAAFNAWDGALPPQTPAPEASAPATP